MGWQQYVPLKEQRKIELDMRGGWLKKAFLSFKELLKEETFYSVKIQFGDIEKENG